MKAARLYGPGDIRVDQIEEPVPGKGQVKVKVVLQLTGLAVDPMLTKRTCAVQIAW
jgi:hypothetical protein